MKRPLPPCRSIVHSVSNINAPKHPSLVLMRLVDEHPLDKSTNVLEWLACAVSWRSNWVGGETGEAGCA